MKLRDILKSNKRIGVALGGGGARGLAHIGVLKILERAGVPIDVITGTSIGSLVGAMYAMNPNSEVIYQKFAEFLLSPMYRGIHLERLNRRKDHESFFAQVTTSVKERVVINLAQSRMSLATPKKVFPILEFFLGDHQFSETLIPFAAVSVDLYTGKEVIFTEGDITRAVASSSAIPGFLPPIKDDGRLLVDGFVLNPVPILPARKLGADIIIAVDVGQTLITRTELNNIIDIIFRSNQITARKYNALLLEQADLVLRPAVGHFHWTEFKHLNEIVLAGEKVAQAKLPEILNLIRPRRNFLRRLLTRQAA